MATILLNGVVTDASTLTGTDLADKLTVSGGVDSLSAQLSGGDDLLEIYADSENLSDVELRLGTGDDVITAVANDGALPDIENRSVVNAAEEFVGLPMNMGGLVTGGEGDDAIDLGDGLVTLTGTVKGNQGEDTIDIARVNGGLVQGLSDDDDITIGLSVDRDFGAGSRAEVSLNNATINGSSGDDTIDVEDEAVLTDSTIRGNEGDDFITIDDGTTAVGSVSIEGNAGDDTINSTGLGGSATIRGGSGNDRLIVGDGQTVFGGKGTDTFIVASEGGAVLGDYDNLEGGDVDCFCDEDIQVDGWQFDVATYNVNTEVYTSASSWTGDIKVKAVAVADGEGDTAVARLTKTKTETLTAFAVARAFITEDTGAGKKAVIGVLGTDTEYAVQFPNQGITKSGKTFANGQNDLAISANWKQSFDGIGQAFASAEGLWYTRNVTTGFGGNNVTVKGLVNPVTAKTYTQFEKGDFSFLQLTNKATVGVEVGQKLLFNDVTNATVKNHWASYTKDKRTLTSKTLQEINFGTAAFEQITTGKAYMVITKGLDTAKVYATKTLTDVDGAATATAQLDLDNDFHAWRGVTAKQATFKDANGNVVLTNSGLGFKQITAFSDTAATGPAAGFVRLNVNGKEVITNSNLVTGNVVIGTANNNNTYQTVKFGPAGRRQTGTLLDNSDLLYATLQTRNLLTLTTTAKFGTTAVKLAGATAGNFVTVNRLVGINNTNVTQDDFITQTGKLVMKIQASDIATAKASAAVNTLVERMTVANTVLPVTSCPEFPTTGSLNTRIVDGFAKHGEVTGDFNKNFVFTSNVITTTTAGKKAATSKFVNSLDKALSKGGLLTEAALNNTAFGFGQGFFSASTFTVDALAKEGFGSQAVVEAGAAAQDVPFRVLFLDNDEADNGLYVVSGLANYNGGNLTGLRTNATTVGGSTMAGKHTIVKVTGDKGHPIELSDITFI